MEELKKMLVALVNSQSVMKDELVREIHKSGDKLDKKIDGVEERLTKRIDKIGLQVANLEDDTPTRDEFDDHEKRISKLESSAPFTS